MMQAGAALETGDALCSVEVEDAAAVNVSRPFSGTFTAFPSRRFAGSRGKDDSALVKFNVNSAGIAQLLSGYDFNGEADPVTPLLEVVGTMRLAADDFAETKEAVSSRADKAALEELAEIENLMRGAVERPRRERRVLRRGRHLRGGAARQGSHRALRP